MRDLRFICCVALALSAARAESPPPPPSQDDGNGRIVGGREAEPGTVPWQVEMFNIYPWSPEQIKPRPVWSKQHQCGGALIAPDVVLTAAHCIESPEDMKGFRILTSTQTLENRGVRGGVGRVYLIADYVVHEGWSGKNGDFRNDIAILRIAPDPEAQPAANPGLARPIEILPPDAPAPVKPDDIVAATGWGSIRQRAEGRVRAGELLYPPNLQIADALRVLPAAACVQGASGATIDTNTTICAAGEVTNGQEVSACQGDSGGPLVRQRGYGPRRRDYVLVGLVSWGKGCGLPGHPGYFTNVPAYLPWIRAKMAKWRPTS